MNRLFSLFHQQEAEDALAEALPALEEARLALQDLDKSDVTEIRWEQHQESNHRTYVFLQQPGIENNGRLMFQ